MHVMIYFLVYYVLQMTHEDVAYWRRNPKRVNHNLNHTLRAMVDHHCYWCA